MRIDNHAQRVGGAAALALIGLVCLVGAVAKGTAEEHVGAASVSLVLLVAAFRIVQLGVQIHGPIITIRNLFQTTVLTWSSVRDVVVIDSGNITGHAT